MTTRFLPALAMLSAVGASVEAGMPTDPGTIEALSKWPLTVVLGAVCVAICYLMYRQGRDHSNNLISMADGERQANAMRAENYSKVTRELAERNAQIVKEMSESHTKDIRMLLDEFVKQRTKD